MAQVSIKHRSLTLKLKFEILKEVDRKVKSKTDIALQFGIPKSTLSTILKNRQKIENAVLDGKDNNSPWTKVKKMRGAAQPKLEEALFAWIKNLRTKNIPIDGQMLKMKAEEFSLKMNIENIKFSDGWVQNFKKRYNLTFRKVCGESADADSTAAAAWKESRLADILKEYKPEDVYNADETGLFFKVLPNNTFTLKNEKCSGGKLSKVRVTILLAANMTGTDKLPLFVIGKAAKPRCFKGMKTLPVKYAASRKAWMTENLFHDWIREVDRQMAGKKRNVLLIVDNCTAHSAVEGLTNVKLEFLPPNVTSLIQPLDQGVIQAFKRKYRRSLVQRMILNIDNGKEYEVDLLKAIYLSAASWDSISAELISNCFRHAGFGGDLNSTDTILPNQDELAADEELLDTLRANNVDVPAGLKFADFLQVDHSLEVSGDLTDEDILKNVLAENQDDSDASEDESSATPEAVRPTFKAATDALDILRRYFEFETDADELLKMTVAIEKKLFSSFTNNLKQSKITDFV